MKRTKKYLVRVMILVFVLSFHVLPGFTQAEVGKVNSFNDFIQKQKIYLKKIKNYIKTTINAQKQQREKVKRIKREMKENRAKAKEMQAKIKWQQREAKAKMREAAIQNEANMRAMKDMMRR